MLCQRCKKESDTLSMSFFNTEMCCSECLIIESKHPKYKEAKDRELNELKVGNRNYEGIGLPTDYDDFSERLKK